MSTACVIFKANAFFFLLHSLYVAYLITVIKKTADHLLALVVFCFFFLTLTAIIVDRPLVLSLGGEKNASWLQFMALLRKIYQTLLFIYTDWAVLAIEKLLDNLLSNLIKNVCIGFSILPSTSMSFRFTQEKLLHALGAYVFYI